MNELTKLTLPWSELKQLINELASEGVKLHERKISDVEEFEKIKLEAKVWDDAVIELLKTSFQGERNTYLTDYYSAYRGSFNTSMPKHLSHLAQDFRDQINSKVYYLHGMDSILEICDAIVKPDQIDLEEMAKLNTKQKLTLLMDKLFDVYDDNYYPIEEILIGNGVKLKRYDEARELAQMLIDNGYADMVGGLGASVNLKLTAYGAMTVEESREPVRENYEDINYPPQVFNSKIDEIIESLKRHEGGQEILFDELQELKELYVKLSKKNFGQVLKGKLIDLAIGKFVENDTISYIYNSITDHPLQLPRF